MKLTSISGVLLAYHEEHVIKNSIAQLEAQLKSLAAEYEVIVVGFAGCKDKTNQIVEEISKQNPRVRLVLQKVEEKGYGRAFYLGLAAARYDWVFQTDADGQYEITDLGKLVAEVRSDIDLVHGYRKKRNDPFERLVMAFCYNMALRILFGIPLKDVDSAFKLIRRKTMVQHPLKALSGFCVAELVIRLKYAGSKFRQLPVTHLAREGGEALSEKGIKNPFNLQIPNFNLVSGTLGEMFRFRLNLRTELQASPQPTKA